MAPVFQRPLDLGADICMTSMTKFIGGHSDLTGGILSVKGTDLAARVYFTQVPAADCATAPACHADQPFLPQEGALGRQSPSPVAKSKSEALHGLS